MKAETTTIKTIEQLKAEIEVMMAGWRTTYSSAWDYLESAARLVIDPGYIDNPWGRRRYFPRTSDRELLAGYGRESRNFRIQSCVADTCMIALQLMREYRANHGLGFRIVNQIHDAVLLEVPEAEVDRTREMLHLTMGSIDIPILGRPPLRLGLDIDVMTRWGEKVKKVKAA